MTRGWNELQLKLDRMPRAMRSQAVQGALEAAVLPVEETAKRRVSVKSGTLRSSISHESERKGSEVIARVGTNVPYARRIELGFTGRDSLGRVYDQAAKPYLRPAAEERKRDVAETFGRALFQILEAAA